MSIDLWWLGHATSMTAKVVVRADSTGEVQIVSNDGSFLPVTHTADTNVNDGLIAFEVTNLSPDRYYGFTITQDASSVTGNIRTMPESGSFNVMWYSCSNRSQRWWALALAKKYDVRAIISLGDTPYSYPVDNWGEDTIMVEDNPQDINTIYSYHRQEHRIVEFAKAIQDIPFYYMWNDHDGIAGDDWDHSVTQANARNIPDVFTTQEEVDNHFVVARQAFEAYSIGNPIAANESPEKPPSSNKADTDYPPQYFKFTIGDAEFFISDGVSHCGLMGSNTTLAGSVQREWLKTQINNSTSKFKVWVDGYKLWATSIAESKNSWESHPTERDNILDSILSATKGVIHLSGDRHHPTVQYATNSHYADYLVDVTACPFHNSYNIISPGYDSPSGKDGIIIYKAGGESGGLEGVYRCVGILQVTPEKLTPMIVDINDNIQWQGDILEGTNKLVDKNI